MAAEMTGRDRERAEWRMHSRFRTNDSVGYVLRSALLVVLLGCGDSSQPVDPASSDLGMQDEFAHDGQSIIDLSPDQDLSVDTTRPDGIIFRDSALAPFDLSLSPEGGLPDLAVKVFQPTDVAGLTAWFRADRGVFQDSLATKSVAKDGDPVAYWNESVQRDDASQGNNGSQPRYQASAIHGMPAICFDHAQYLTLVRPITVGDHSIFVVTRPDFTHQSVDVLLGSTKSFVTGFYQPKGTSMANYYYFTGTVAQTSQIPTPPGVWQVAVSDRGGSTWYPRLNGESLSQGSAITSEPQVISSFAHYTGNDFNGCVAEVLVYDRLIADADRDQIRKYLASRYGISGAVPARTIYSGGPLGDYNISPSSVSLLDGDPSTGRPPTLVTVFRNAPMHTHRGEVLTASSRDSGSTWSTPTVAASDPVNDVRTNNGMVRLGNGRLLLPLIEENDTPSMGLGFTVVGSFLVHSDDSGKTWSAPLPIANPPGYRWFFSYGTILERPGGVLLMPGYGTRSTATTYWDSLLLVSMDGGASWQLRGKIATGTSMFGYNETAIAYRGSTLVAAVRGEQSSQIWFTSSADDGKTWLPPQALEFGVSPVLLPLSDGRVLFASGVRAGYVRGVFARILRTDAAGNPDVPRMKQEAAYPMFAPLVTGIGLGYPAPVEMPDGRIFVNWYSEINGTDTLHSQIWAREFDLAGLGP